MARASAGGERASARRAHIAGTRRKLRPKKAKEPLITLTKSSLVTPIAPPRRARAASSEGGVGLRSAGVGAAILDAESCVAVAEATSRARAIFIIGMPGPFNHSTHRARGACFERAVAIELCSGHRRQPAC